MSQIAFQSLEIKKRGVPLNEVETESHNVAKRRTIPRRRIIKLVFKDPCIHFYPYNPKHCKKWYNTTALLLSFYPQNLGNQLISFAHTCLVPPKGYQSSEIGDAKDPKPPDSEGISDPKIRHSYTLCTIEGGESNEVSSFEKCVGHDLPVSQRPHNNSYLKRHYYFLNSLDIWLMNEETVISWLMLQTIP